MAQAARTFRIFVSSTFEDLKEERNALQERVFPELKKLCLAHNTRFQAIDLRWGVSEEAGIDQRTINICLQEIERCRQTSPRPNFIVLLGDRYGWRPPPPQIPAEEFGEILARVDSVEDGQLLGEWYPRDSNAVPPEHCLKPRQGELEDYGKWEPVERRLRRILLAAVTGIELERDPRYVASATEQEIVRGALTYPDAKDHVFCFFRTIEGLPEDTSAGPHRELDEQGEPDAEASGRLARLKDALRSRLPADHIHEYEASWSDGAPSKRHLDALCADVKGALERVILEEIEGIEAEEQLEKEIADHERFGAERAGDFVGRGSALERIDRYIGGADRHPLAVYGASGSGKSALIARAAQRTAEGRPKAELILRFIGATPQSSDGRDLLRNLCRQIARRYRESGATAPPPEKAEGTPDPLDESTVPTGYRELVEDLPKRLALACAERPLVVFLDALDQLSDADGARSLAWLPAELPEHVRLVVSAVRREAEGDGDGAAPIAPRDPLAALRARLPAQSLAELEPMSREVGGELLDAWLAGAKRKLTSEQRAAVLGRFESEGLPLYLKLAFEEARRWKSYTPASETALSEEGIAGIIRDNLWVRLAAPENHGRVMVSRSLAYLAAARNGLSEDELLDVLSEQEEVLEDFRKRTPKSPPIDRLPVVVWSRLYFDLAPYLTERSADGAPLMGFYHRQLAEVIGEDLLQGGEGRDRHRELARYFADDEAQPLERKGDGKLAANLRRLSELPYQQTCGEQWDDVFDTLTDFHFLELKVANSGVVESEDAEGKTSCTHTGVYLLEDDYALALERMPGNGSGGRMGGRRRIIVTGTDLGHGLQICCPHCNELLDCDEDWRGKEMGCPRCQGPWRVNSFVVERP